MRFYLYFLFIWLVSSCVNHKNDDLKYSPESKLNYNHQFSLSTEDNNVSLELSFQSTIKNRDLHDLILKALKENPSWHAKLAKLDLAKSKSGFRTDGSKPLSKGSIGLNQGQEKSKITNFQTSRTPRWESSAMYGWEVDLWGKWNERKKESAKFIEAEKHVLEGAKLKLIYSITERWLMACFLKEELAIATRQIRDHNEAHILHLHKYNAGLDDNISLIKMETQIKLQVLEHNRIKQDLDICMIQLGTLLGSPLDGNLSEIPNLSSLTLPSLPSLLPSRLLQGRPDILAGQLKIYAQAHRINASRLNLYPSLNLNLSGIGMSGDLSDGFEQWKFSGGPVIDLPILNPKRRTQLRIDEASLKMIDLEWKASLLRAVREIESATIKHQSNVKDFNISQNLVDEFIKAYQISDLKFQAGLISRIDLIQEMNRLNESKRTSLNYRSNYWKSFLILSERLGINWLD